MHMMHYIKLINSLIQSNTDIVTQFTKLVVYNVIVSTAKVILYIGAQFAKLINCTNIIRILVMQAEFFVLF